MSRLIAIGDVHGCSAAFQTLLAAIDLKREDTLVMLGDYVDRGPNSAEVVETLVDLVSRCRLVPLIGNHELMMAQAFENGRDRDFWLKCGGEATVKSYGGHLKNVPQHHKMFLRHCVRFYEHEKHFFVHANYDPELSLSDQSDDLLFWTHIEDDLLPGPHENGKIAVVGHTPQENFEIKDFGHGLIIDTFCYGGGWLTAMDMLSGTVWQANEYGEQQVFIHSLRA